MAEIKHGSVTITLPEGVELPEEAGKLSPLEVQRLPKARRLPGWTCDRVAASIESLEGEDEFHPPQGVTPEALREAGRLAHALHQNINDLEVVLQRLKQAELLYGAHAHKMLCATNDQYKAQAKRRPMLRFRFEPLKVYFQNK